MFAINDYTAISRRSDLGFLILTYEVSFALADAQTSNFHALHMTNTDGSGITQDDATKCSIYYL